MSLEAEAYTLISRGFALLAEAARKRDAAPAPTVANSEWLPVSESPLGKRKTLELARAGVLASTKTGRKVLILRPSLDAHLNQNRRVQTDDEDLFGAPPTVEQAAEHLRRLGVK